MVRTEVHFLHRYSVVSEFAEYLGIYIVISESSPEKFVSAWMSSREVFRIKLSFTTFYCYLAPIENVLDWRTKYLGKYSLIRICSGSYPSWMSFVILRISSAGTKFKFREVEKVALKICLLNSPLSFNETCLNNKLLPTFTYIYIYIHIIF